MNWRSNYAYFFFPLSETKRRSAQASILRFDLSWYGPGVGNVFRLPQLHATGRDGLDATVWPFLLYRVE